MNDAYPSFESLGVSREVIETLAANGIHAPFPIQVMVIQDATSGRDTLAKSRTGSGNTPPNTASELVNTNFGGCASFLQRSSKARVASRLTCMPVSNSASA
jgi:hypothetical protein